MRRELAESATATAFAMHKPEDLQRVLALPKPNVNGDGKWWESALEEDD